MRAVCVEGLVDGESLGVVLPHEHLNADGSFLCQAPDPQRIPVEQIPADELRRAPMDYLANLDMRDEQVATAEAAALVRAGGRTLVDLTTNDLGRDPQLLARVSAATGLRIIMATGYYTHPAHPAELRHATVEEIAQRFVADIQTGVEGIRAGVIGEIGTDDPVHPQEMKVLRAAAQAHLATGCPVNVHFAAKCREVFTVLDLFRAEGVKDLAPVVVSHMDVAIDLEQQRAVAEMGATIEYDTFGHEAYPDSKGNLMPRDEERLEALARLVSWGLAPRLLVSHDVCFKSQWRRYGGYGYTDLLDRLRPIMPRYGLDARAQEQLFVTNPRRLFAFMA